MKTSLKKKEKLAINKTILGIDPGSNIMGYGVIRVNDNKVNIVAMGVVKTAGFDGHYQKLRHIFDRTLYLVDEYKPDETALEAPFFGKVIFKTRGNCCKQSPAAMTTKRKSRLSAATPSFRQPMRFTKNG